MLNKARFIKASFNKRLGLYFSLVTIFTMFGSIPIANWKLPFFFAFFPVAAVFLFVFGKNFLYPSLRFAFSLRKSTTIPAPKQFQDLAKRMGRSLSKIKIIDSDKKNAYSSANGIAFTRGLLEECNKDEIMAVAAHELGHQKGHHLLYKAFLLVSTMLLTAFMWSRFTAPILVNEAFTLTMFQSMMEVALLAFVMVVMIPANWVMELRADKAAAEFVGKRSMKSAIRRIAPKEAFKHHSETHPSTYERIQYIKGLKFNRAKQASLVQRLKRILLRK